MAIRGISDRVLGERLHELVAAGLVTHSQPQTGPATYSLTPDGQLLAPALEQIRTWWRQRTEAAAGDRPA